MFYGCFRKYLHGESPAADEDKDTKARGRDSRGRGGRDNEGVLSMHNRLGGYFSQ